MRSGANETANVPEPGTAQEDAATASSEVWIGVATDSRWRWTYAIAFALVLVSGFAAALLNPALSRSPDERFSDGSWAEAYQRSFDAASPLLAPARTAWGIIDTGLFGQGRLGVLVGEEGWLYSREEYATVPDATSAIEATVARIASVRSSLAEQGVELVVALVPAKAAMVPEQAPAPLPAAAAERYEALMTRLRDAGVIVSDLRPPLAGLADGTAAYLRTDTHWTPSGAAAAAATIARTINEHAPFADLGQRRYRTEVGPAEEHWGDLTVFLDLGPLLPRFGPPADLLAVPQTHSLDPASSDLLGPVEVPVALVGTSYSADARWNAVGALREALGTDVIDAALSGLGPWEPMRRYLEGEAFVTARPELVIWEFPERYATLEGHVPESATW